MPRLPIPNEYKMTFLIFCLHSDGHLLVDLLIQAVRNLTNPRLVLNENKLQTTYSTTRIHIHLPTFYHLLTLFSYGYPTIYSRLVQDTNAITRLE